EESGVLLNGDDGVEFAAETEDEDLERSRQNEEVAEARAGKEEADGGGHKRNDKAPFLLVEAGRDEEPHLIEDEGRGEDGAADQRNLQIQVQRIHRVRVVQLDAQFVERGLNEAVETFMEHVGDEKADGKKNCGVNNALAELFEVLHEAHARKFRALRDGLLCLLDCVAWINHGGRPAPIFRLRERRLRSSPEARWRRAPEQRKGPAAAFARRGGLRRPSRRWKAAGCAAR